MTRDEFLELWANSNPLCSVAVPITIPIEESNMVVGVVNNDIKLELKGINLNRALLYTMIYNHGTNNWRKMHHLPMRRKRHYGRRQNYGR